MTTLPVPVMLPVKVVLALLPPTSSVAAPSSMVPAETLAMAPTRWLKPARTNLAPLLTTTVVLGESWLAMASCRAPPLMVVSPV